MNTTRRKGVWTKRALKRSGNVLWRLTGSPRRWYRCRERFLGNLPRRSVGIEMGVFRGEFSRHILETVQPRELHLVDVWWTQFGDYFPDWGEYTNHGRLATRAAFAEVGAIVADQGFEDRATLHAGNDVEYLSGFDDGHFDWAYVDSSHQYDHTLRELQVLGKKTKPHGIICGHDWQPDPSHRHHGVCRAVKEFCAAEGYRVVLLDNHSQWAVRRA